MADSFQNASNDLRSMQAFISARRNNPGLMAEQTDAFQSRIGSITDLDAGRATELVRLVESGPWTDEQQTTLLRAVEARLSGAPPDSSRDATTTRRPNQNFDGLSMWLPRKLVQKHQDQNNRAQDVLEDVATFMMSAGIVLPSEKTYQGAVVTLSLLRMLPTIGDPAEGHNWVKYLKNAIKRKRLHYVRNVPTPPEWMTDFPQDPRALPQNWFSAIYGDNADDQPSLLVVNARDVDQGRVQVPCRKTSSSLSGIPQARDQLQQLVGARGNMQMQNMMLTMMQTMMQQQHGSSRGAGRSGVR